MKFILANGYAASEEKIKFKITVKAATIKLFEKRLEYQKKIIKEIENITIDDMIKLKIKRINNINYNR